MEPSFDQLLQAGLQQELTGWDFSWFNAHTRSEPLSWDYETLARERVAQANAVLDMETGGGEILSRLGPFPLVTWATEGYPPNVVVARARLEPLGIQVADVSSLEDELPFPDNTFDLVINRHGGINAEELYRVMQPDGLFFTQQVGGQNCLEINQALQDKVEFIYAHETLDYHVRHLELAGFKITDAREEFTRLFFSDISTVVFYLKAIPWQIVDFSIDTYRENLLRLHKKMIQDGGFTIREHRLLIEAVKQA